MVPDLHLNFLCNANYALDKYLQQHILFFAAGKKIFSAVLKVSQKEFARKRISQITVVEENNMIISLSDGMIRVHSLPSLQLVTQVVKSKGCLFYVEDRSGGVLRLCAALKRKTLLLLHWNGNELQEFKELTLPDVAKAVAWCGESLCVAIKKEYNLVPYNSGAPKFLLPLENTERPLTLSLPDQQVLLQRETASVFMGFDGQPRRSYALKWSEPPVALGYSFPYVIALLSKTIEIQMIFRQKPHIQTIPLASPRYIASAHSPLKKQKSAPVYIASKLQIWRLEPIPLTKQIEELITNHDYEEALSLAENIDFEELPNKLDILKRIRTQYGYHLFAQGQYARAMEYFYLEKVDPLQVIALYPNLLPETLRPKYHIPSEIAVKERTDDVGLERAYLALITFLVQRRSEFINTLKDIDIKMQTPWNKTTDPAQIIDTTLLKAYLRTKPKLVQSLLRLPNCCHVKECERVLLLAKKHHELVMLYKGKGLHREALHLLKNLGQTSPDDFGGSRPTIDYLKELGKEHLDLILEFSVWVLQYDTSKEGEIAALEIFTADRKPEDMLPPETILRHLKAVRPSLIIPYLEYVILELGNETPELHNELVLQYLDRIIELRKRVTDPSILKRVAGTEPGELGTLRVKLLTFLEESKCYAPEKILSRYNLTDEGLIDERALLLSRLGQHDLVLREYVHKLYDFKLAEDYCNKHYNPEKEESRDVYLSLLRAYLSPEMTPIPRENGMVVTANPKELRAAAFDLLDRHFMQIDIPKALQLLPEDTPFSGLYPFFEKVLRLINQKRRQNVITVNVARSEAIKIKKELMKLQRRSIKITEDTVCISCRKRLGEAVFASYPNGDVIHYKCLLKQNQPLTSDSSAFAEQQLTKK
jgi:hypothetical protein